MIRALLVLMLSLAAYPADAGAWLREHKTGFLAFSGTVDENSETEGSVYAEYGLRPKLTLGFKGDANLPQGRLGEGSVFLFARLPIHTGDKPYKLAYEIGLGGTFGLDFEPMVRTGLSYGRGLSFGETSGWFAVDAAVEWAQGDASDIRKLDTTVGVNLSERFKVMMQVFYTGTDLGDFFTYAPSLIWQPTPKTPSFQIGVESDDGILSLKLGLWRTF
ncbi:hypothetical protein [uncultured Tateyamaria sp.]|uniref:hypothetical protein n=1 Tax=uncultured Tateyamaria sp. TaxID=455651 RepID=UPI002632EDD1|nr:hypothetical protein [uncultured Tateyamaria sp.]